MSIQDVLIARHDGGYRLEFSAVFAAGIEDLWSAVTSPERLRRWMARYVVGPGHEWQALSAGGDVWSAGAVTECEPSRRYVTTWRHAGEPETLVEVVLESSGGVTLLRLTHGIVPSTDYGPGWHAYLLALADHVAEPHAERDDELWERRYRELEPVYSARFSQVDGEPRPGA